MTIGSGVEHYSRRRSRGVQRGAGSGPSARPLDRNRGQRRPPEAPRPEFIPILVQMKRPEVVAVSWPAIVSNRALAIGVILSAMTISIVAISLLIQVG